MQNTFADSPIQVLKSELLTSKGIKLLVKRDDLIHPHIQGNKWRKLKYNLLEARLIGHNTLLTFGGPYSNHIYATAAAAKLFHFKSIGIIRGEEGEVVSPTLRFADSQGMQLHYMDRTMYREKESPEAMESLRVQIGDFYHIPEGGTNILALEGVKEIIDEIEQDFDVLTVSCGTGGTLAGLVAGLQGKKRVIGFSSLKGTDTLTAKVNQLTTDFCGNVYTNFQITFDYHFGGYANATPELFQFILDFKNQHHISIEPVYTAKMFYGLFKLIESDCFQRGTTIIAIHTGGLQGLSGYPQLASLTYN